MRFSFTSPESQAAEAHPLYGIKIVADQVLRELAPTFAVTYSAVGRPSIPLRAATQERGADHAVFGAEPLVVLRAVGLQLTPSLVSRHELD